jgi:hypothetical protein
MQKAPGSPGPCIRTVVAAPLGTPAAGIPPLYLIFVSLYATCLRATGSNLRTSILSGWRRLFLVVT